MKLSPLLVGLAALACSRSSASSVPADWQAAVDAGDMLFAPTLAAPGYMPRLSNGRLGIELFRGINYGDEGVMYSVDVFNGFLNVTPSSIAAIPSPWLGHLQSTPAQPAVPVGGAMDMRNSMYLNRTIINPSGSQATGSGASACPPNTVVEMRWYAHADIRELLVFEMEPVSGMANGQTCDVEIAWPFVMGAQSRGDFNQSVTEISTPGGFQAALWVGQTLVPETTNGPTHKVAMVFPPEILKNGTMVATLQPGTTVLFPVAVTTNDTHPHDSVQAALEVFEGAYARGAEDLHRTHEFVWAKNWRAGIEIEGNLTIAAAANSSLYYLMTNMNAAEPWSVSPCGVGSNCYHQHR